MTPYKDPRRQKEWERRHRKERVVRRRVLRRIEAVKPTIESTATGVGESSYPWHLLVGGGLLALYDPVLGLGAGSLVLTIAAFRKKDWTWWLIGAAIAALALFLLSSKQQNDATGTISAKK